MAEKVKFFKSEPFENSDARREIRGVAGELGIHLEIAQIKLIQFNQTSVNNRLVVGNHKHLGDSDQWEFIIIIGSREKQLIDFRYRNDGELIKKKILFGGDIVAIPPGCCLGLIPLDASAKIIEISNKTYDSKNYAFEDLFSENQK